MIVCICHRISDRDIAAAAAAGCGSFEELQVDTGVATQCGACLGCARETFEQHTQARCGGAAGCNACAAATRRLAAA
jgi:bacterioferritin-associated ferredoxin